MHRAARSWGQTVMRGLTPRVEDAIEKRTLGGDDLIT
jgi:hypothetical protein